MQARLLCFELPEGWKTQSTQSSPKNLRKSPRRESSRSRSPRREISSALPLTGEQITNARKNLRLSQRDLANQIGKSQSWVRDIESGRLQVSAKDQQLLRQMFGGAL